MLHNNFVCAYKDIGSESYAGNSGAHGTRDNAVETTNGAGSHNIQMFVMDPDGTVLTCMPGYWNPDDLAGELRLAESLDRVWKDGSMSVTQKKAAFSRMQLEHFKHHSSEEIARSHMQGFDKQHELMRKGFSDTLRMAPSANAMMDGGSGDDLVKTTDEIMHERMSQRAFVAYSHFDTGHFVDYGTHFYDKHESNLDADTGKMIDPEAKTLTMREAMGGRAHHSARQSSGPHVQVRTYGTLRSKPQS